LAYVRSPDIAPLNGGVRITGTDVLVYTRCFTMSSTNLKINSSVVAVAFGATLAIIEVDASEECDAISNEE
jgi:hypothetical protein